MNARYQAASAVESTAHSSRELEGRRSGASILCDALIGEGADTVFGYPGGAVLSIYGALADAAGSLRHVRARHEQGAVHMAEGYARSTGRVGVVLVTSGPGATNVVTGVANAYMDSTPLVVICGQASRPAIGADAFQEVDIVGITRPCTKYSYRVRSASEIAGVVREAFYLAATGRPGPVLIDVPGDVAAECASDGWPDRPEVRGYEARRQPDGAALQEAAARLLGAARPVICVGGGAVHAGCSQEILALAEKTAVPVVLTLMALGTVPGDHPLCLGMLGMHGRYAANMAVAHADLVFVLGSRLDERVTGEATRFAPGAAIVHVNIDASCIGRRVAADVAIAGDLRVTARALLAMLATDPDVVDPHRLSPWWERIAGWLHAAPRPAAAGEDAISPGRLMSELAVVAHADALVTTDVGQHQMWVAQHFPFRRPRQLLTSGGLGTMGFGLPAAIGAQMAFPGRQVLAVVGDGGFQMTVQELATAIEQRAPVKVVIVNNGCLGMVRQWQQYLHGGRYAAVSMEHQPDFVALARAYGARGFRVSRGRDLRWVLASALAAPGPVVVDVVVPPDENVVPTVLPGAGLGEMVCS